MGVGAGAGVGKAHNPAPGRDRRFESSPRYQSLLRGSVCRIGPLTSYGALMGVGAGAGVGKAHNPAPGRDRRSESSPRY